jgi:hypothetical protein
MRRAGLALLVVGLAMTFVSCTAFGSQFGSDYAAINGFGIIGATIGVLLMLAGLPFAIGGDKRD